MAFRLWLTALALLVACGEDKDDKKEGGGPAVGGEQVCSFADTNDGSGASGSGLANPLLPLQASSRYDGLADEIMARLAVPLPAGVQVTLGGRRVAGRAEHLDFLYQAAGLPLCEAASRVHLVDDRIIYRDELAAGSLDARAWSRVDELTFASPEGALARAAESLGVDDAAPSRVIKSDRCWLVKDGLPVAATRLSAFVGDRPYEILADAGRLVQVTPAWFDAADSFDATGEAQTYEANALDATLVTVPLTELATGTSRLESRRFTTKIADDVKPAEAEDRRYVFAPTDDRFPETAMFANAERMAAWFTKAEHAYELGCVPIGLEPHAQFEDPYSDATSVNNGAYIPPEATGTGYPLIRMGDGDGAVLQNLVTDFDTVAHELGHHIIYRSIKKQKDAAGVLHEGLADYFVFAATGDACLGESVCPAGSGICEVEAQCLRTADNTYRFGAADLPAGVHRISQFISGYLWDVGKQAGIGHDQVGKTVIKAIDYLGASPSYGDFVKALLDADLELAAGAHGCAFLDGAKARGLEDDVAELTCTP